MFRSASMDYYSIFFNKEYALEVLGELGQLGIIELEDLHPDQLEPARNYFSQVQELDHSLELLEKFKDIAEEADFDDYQYQAT